jgi:hypothetical protein
MLAEIYLLNLETAVRAAKEPPTRLRPRGLCRSPYRLPRRPNRAFHRALARHTLHQIQPMAKTVSPALNVRTGARATTSARSSGLKPLNRLQFRRR